MLTKIARFCYSWAWRWMVPFMPCASKVNAYYSHYNKSKIRRLCNEELRFVPYMVYKSGPAEIRNSQINFIVKRNELQSIRSSYRSEENEKILTEEKTATKNTYLYRKQTLEERRDWFYSSTWKKASQWRYVWVDYELMMTSISWSFGNNTFLKT